MILEEPTREIIAICQRSAMMSPAAAHMTSWKRLRPMTDEDKAIAGQNEKIVKAFVDAIPEDQMVTQDEDVFRRFTRANTKPLELALDVHHVRTMLRLYNSVYNIFRTDKGKEEFIEAATERRFRTPSVHLGWQRICNEVKGKKPRKAATGRKAAPAKESTEGAGGDINQEAPSLDELKALYQFVINDVRLFMIASREGQEAHVADKADFWPSLESELYRTIQEAPGNTVKVELTVPEHKPSDPVKVSESGNADEVENEVVSTATRNGVNRHICAFIRGNAPFSRSEKLTEPFAVKNGLAQFIPDRVMRFNRNKNRSVSRTFLKMQKLTLLRIHGRLMVNWTATHITQVSRDPKITKQHSQNIQPGERMAVLHLLPSGSLLCTVSLFEKTASNEMFGWKQIPLMETINDTRKESYQIMGGERVKVRTQRDITKLFLEINDMPYALAARYMEAEKKRVTAGRTILENAETLKACGNVKTSFGKTYYRGIAAHLAKVLRHNNAGYLLVAGGGRLAVERTIPHPVKKFFSASQSTGRMTLTGFLDNATKKSGVTMMVTTARAAKIWVKPAVLEGKMRECQFVTFPEPTLPVDQRPPDWRNRKVIAPNPEVKTEQVPYAKNSAWAILLDHQVPAFHEHVDSLVEAQKQKLQSTPPANAAA